MLSPFLLAALAIAAPEPDRCSGKFIAMARYAGEYSGRFLDDPVVKSRMKALLGSDAGRLRTSLDVHGPIALINCELVVEGNAPHQGGERNGILSFGLHSGKMTVGMLEKGHVTIVTGPAASDGEFHYHYLPRHVQWWAYFAVHGFPRDEPTPPNVTVQFPRGKWLASPGLRR